MKKKTIIISSVLLMSLTVFAFTPANKHQTKKCIDISNDLLFLTDKEVSSFQEFETSVYTPSKATYNKRVRYWTLTGEESNEYDTNIESVISRN